MGVDLVVDMAPGQIQSLADVKFDLFPPSADPFHRAEFGRRVVVRLDLPGFGLLELPVATAEDCFLSKLEWYRRGGETSGRQQEDVLGIIRTSQRRLDMDYLRHWSSRLGVPDVLERAFGEGS